MAKKDKINIDNTGVDKLEAFMQNNIKMIVILISALVVLFIAVYLGYTAYGISKNKKIDSLSLAEMIMIDNSSVDTFLCIIFNCSIIKGLYCCSQCRNVSYV